MDLVSTGDGDLGATAETTLATGDFGVPHADGASRTSLAPGATLGRYVVLTELGAGAMGIVLMAYDPELDRRVAVKLLKPDAKSRGERLRREAQALARLAHPNVVEVYDVGEHGAQFFVAMEYVEGQTLREWCARTPAPSVAEIIDVFISAGRGLAAAHEVGMAHRDFKPDNVMVGHDGRVRVMDFGLARGTTVDTDDLETGTPSVLASSASLLEAPLTVTGGMMGTPAYMAPEQFRGKADAKSDQFAFCVALFEALYGRRPFEGRTIRQLQRATHRGFDGPFPAQPSVPNRVKHLLGRGLAPRPDERFDEMRTLLEVLDFDPSVGRRRWLAGGAMAIVLAGTVGGLWVTRQPAIDECPSFDANVPGVWDDERRQAIRASFQRLALPFGDDAASLVESGLDGYAERLAEGRRDACSANRAARQSDLMFDARSRCFDRRTAALAAATDLLADADAAVVTRAAEIVAGLPSVAACDDIASLTAAVPMPEEPAARERLADAASEFERVRTLALAGRYREALEVGDSLLSTVEDLDYPPLLAELERERGKVLIRLDQTEAAEASFVRVHQLGLRYEMIEPAFDGVLQLMALAAARDDAEAAAWWAMSAEALADRWDSDDAKARYSAVEGRVELIRGDMEGAIRSFSNALDILERIHGEDALELTYPVLQLGATHAKAGRHEASLAFYERALRIVRERLGPQHPRVAESLAGVALETVQLGRFDEGVEHWERVLELRRQTLGDEHVRVVETRVSLGSTLMQAGDCDRAQAQLEVALGQLSASHASAGHRRDALNALAECERTKASTGLDSTPAEQAWAAKGGDLHE